jgi:hypothetical protein
VGKMQSYQSSAARVDAWELQALGRHGLPVLQRIERMKTQAKRLAGRNDGRCFLLLFEERLLNDLIVDMASAYLDLERVARHMETGSYKVGQTHTDLYRAIVH